MTDLFLRPLFTWRSAVASKHGPASPTTRHVLLTLGLHMSEKGDSCFPSIQLLMDETGLSNKAVITHLEAAKNEGWVGKRDSRRSNGQGWRRIEYFAQIPIGVEKVFHDEQRGEPSSQAQGGEGRSQGGERGTEGGERQSEGGERQESPHIYGSTSKSTPRGKAARSRAHDGVPLPADFKISDGIRAWAEKKGYGPYLEVHFEFFVNWARNGKDGKPRLYLDWEAAFRNAMLGDYGGVRKNARMDKQFGPKVDGAAPIQRTCTEETAPGEPCGLPGESHGATFICKHHWEKRMEKSGPMPAAVREALNKRSRVNA